MDYSDDSDEGESFPSPPYNYKTPWQTPIALTGLKPVMDGIFAEVEANIPALDFDSASEASSDGNEDEPLIFSRNGVLKPLSALYEPGVLSADCEELHLTKAEETEGVPAERVFESSSSIGLKGVSTSSTDSGLSMISAVDHKSSYSDTSHMSSEEDVGSPFEILDNSLQRPRRESQGVSMSNASVQTGTDDLLENYHVGIQTETNDMTQLSLQTVQLNLSQLDDIDFDDLLKQLNEVSVSPYSNPNSLELNNNNPDSESDTGSSSSSTEDLMRQLTSLSKRQSEEAVPVAHAASHSETKQSTESVSIQTNGPTSDTGMMTMLSTSSVGVATSFTFSQSKVLGASSDSRSATSWDGSGGSSATGEERSTRHIDLRSFQKENKDTEEAKMPEYPSSIQRIWGFQRQDSSSSSSEDEDMASWHEQRKKFKESLTVKKKNSTHDGAPGAERKPSPRDTKSTASIPTTTALNRMENELLSVVKNDTFLQLQAGKSSWKKEETKEDRAATKTKVCDQGISVTERKVSLIEGRAKLNESIEDDLASILTAGRKGQEKESAAFSGTVKEQKPSLDVSVLKTLQEIASEEKIIPVQPETGGKANYCDMPSGEVLREMPDKQSESDEKESSKEIAKVGSSKGISAVSPDMISSDVSKTGMKRPRVKQAWGEPPGKEKDEQISQKPLRVVVDEEKHDVVNDEKRPEPDHKLKKTDPEVQTISVGVSINRATEPDDKGKLRTKKQLEHEKLVHKQEKDKKLRMKGMLERVKQQREAKPPGTRSCPSAPATPVVFDMEASYEPPPVALPELTAAKYLLLTATLLACGEQSIGSNRGNGNKGGHKGGHSGSDSHCYSTLVAWLLSLVPVPETSTCIDYSDLCGAPFHVIGMQQTWHEGQLSLKIGIRNRHDLQQARGRQGGKGNNFQGTVTKFLRTNSLGSVLPRIAGYSFPMMTMPFSQRNLSCLVSVNPDPEAMVRVFGTESGFYWKTHEIEDTVDVNAPSIAYYGPEITTTMSLIQYEAFHDPVCMMDVLDRVWKEGLDLAGIRLLYPRDVPLDERAGLDSSSSNIFPRVDPLLALAIRGPDAINRWLDVIGPRDAWLACRTDPLSLRAIYGNESKEDHLFYCPRNSSRADVELARWFGGRVPANDTVNFGSTDQAEPRMERPRSGSRGRSTEQLPSNSLHASLLSPPCTLTASTESSLVLLASPVVPTSCLGLILLLCHERGFTLQGIRRIRLLPQRLKDNNRDVLGLTAAQASVFCPTRGSKMPPASTFVFDVGEEESSSLPALACTVLCLRKENGMRHMHSLAKIITDNLLHLELLPRDIDTRRQISATQLCFAVVPFTEHFSSGVLGNKLDRVPKYGIYTAAFLSHSFYSNPELEQVCVLTLLKEKATQLAHVILNRLLLCKSPAGDTDEVYCGLELLGIKLVSSISMHQAKEFSPYEIGDKLWQSSLRPLASGPALICAFRGINAFERLRTFIHSYVGCSPKKKPLGNKNDACPDMFMSPTPEIAYRQLTTIFYEHELHADHSARTNLHLLPPPRREVVLPVHNRSESPESSRQKGRRSLRSTYSGGIRGNGTCCKVETVSPDDVHIISSLLSGPCPLTTVCVIKPDAIPKHIGKVLRRLSREGFTLVNMRMDWLTETNALALITRDWDYSGDNTDAHVSHMTSGPVLILSVQRENAVGKLLEILGPSIPETARRKSQFYLRASYGTDRVRNALYGSYSYKNAVLDHKLLFPNGVCCSPTMDLMSEEIHCLVRDTIFDVDTKRFLVDVPADAIPSCNTDYLLTTVHLPASLLEINCILLHPCLMRPQGGVGGSRRLVGYTDVMDGLLSTGLQPIGIRMVQLDETQAAQCARLYSDNLHTDIKPYEMAFQLFQGPCVVIAVLRDGAVTSFDTLLGSPIKSNSLVTKYGRHILAARTSKKARRLVECFFDRLMPNMKAQIECSH